MPPGTFDIRIEASGGVPITRQLVDQIRAHCASGALRAGTKLPSVRELAHRLAINQNTVLRAYERLTTEGFIERRHGDGTYVADRLPTGQLKIQKQSLRDDITRLIRKAAVLGVTAEQMQIQIDRAWSQFGATVRETTEMEHSK